MEVYCGQVLATFEINKYIRGKKDIGEGENIHSSLPASNHVHVTLASLVSSCSM